MTVDERPRFFFIHLMKTGGTSFVFQLLQSLSYKHTDMCLIIDDQKFLSHFKVFSFYVY